MKLNHFVPRVPAAGAGGIWGFLGRGLGWLGPSWRQAPLRRIVQAVSLLAFVGLFGYVLWPYPFVAHLLARKEWVPAELFLLLDPLGSLAAALAGRCWPASAWWAVGAIVFGVLVPRGFCGYLCPLGTLIDLGDTVLCWGKKRTGPPARGWWTSVRFVVLTTILVGAATGAMLCHYAAAIPVVTRGLAFSLSPLQLGLLKNWSMVRPPAWEQWLSVALFVALFACALIGRRFWCRCLCPTGALLSLVSVFRRTERKVTSACVECGECVSACSYGAIRDDFQTRPLDCTVCQTCGGACPTGAIQFATRGAEVEAKPTADLSASDMPPRRAFLVGAVAGAAATGVTVVSGHGQGPAPIRPPGSVPEGQFLDLCLRCGECFQACPGPVLRPAGLEDGLEGLWAPKADMTHAGCHPDCNFCTQVCPTGAIRPLDLAAKRKTHMGLAVINTQTCLPYVGEQECALCYDECEAAGYHALTLEPIELEVGDIPEGLFSPDEIEEMGRILAPVVDADRCVGCGLCQYRCHVRWVKTEQVLEISAVTVVAENTDR